MKWARSAALRARSASLPVRGAWVEIYCSGGVLSAGGRRSPCGERGLKYDLFTVMMDEGLVAPRAGSVG